MGRTEGAGLHPARRSPPGRAIIRGVTEEQDTQELRKIQAQRQEAESEHAASAPTEDEAVQHQRRADKAAYLREKLEERAESERQSDR